MRASEAARATTAVLALAHDLGLEAAADGTVVLHDSNKLTLRLRPADVVARIARRGEEVAAQEVALARRLHAAGAPVAALATGIDPGPHDVDGFVVTLWTYHPPVAGLPSTEAVAAALARLHVGMRTVDTDAAGAGAVETLAHRVADAAGRVADPDRTPDLVPGDRALLHDRLTALGGAVATAPAQLLHGEPHPGNTLATADGVRFVDLETVCRGPVEYDLAYAAPEVAGHLAPDAELLAHCRGLVLALVATWRWEAGDQLPGGRRAGQDLLAALRTGPPWPALVDVVPPAPLGHPRPTAHGWQVAVPFTGSEHPRRGKMAP